MLYRGYRIETDNKKVIVKNVRDFDIVHIFESGQCFRWIRQPDNSYTGVAKDRVVNIKVVNDSVIIDNTSFEEFINVWFDYFDLGTDYSKIKEVLSKDRILEEAITFGDGIRLLRQDIWEVIISFIISANNNIPRIAKIIESISEGFGEKLVYKEQVYYTFPSISILGRANETQIAVCKAGYRNKYIADTSTLILEKAVDLGKLSERDTASCRKELLKLPGVGPKVADCIMLFSGMKYDVFPTDVWVRRVMGELYFNREVSMREIQDFVSEKFGSLAGYAQQYLFYYARQNRIGMN